MVFHCLRVLHTAFEMLELDEGKLSRPVLRRGGESNLASLSRRYGLSHHPARKRADFPAVSRLENHRGIDTEGVANDGGFSALVLPTPYGHRRLSRIVQPSGCLTADGSFTRPLRCLSRMKGNFHVRF